MSLSLRSLNTAASTAFDTARTTLKAMADATAPQPGEENAAASESKGAAAMSSEATPAAEVKPASESKVASWIRQGTVLDAYA
jgi:hypothetical protein